MPKFAKICKNLQKSAKIGKIGKKYLPQHARTTPQYDHTLISPDERRRKRERERERERGERERERETR